MSRKLSSKLLNEVTRQLESAHQVKKQQVELTEGTVTTYQAGVIIRVDIKPVFESEGEVSDIGKE